MKRVAHAPQLDFGELRRELKLPEVYPPDAESEAAAAAASVSLPPVDRTDVPFVTIDPATSMDLDQAMCLERRRDHGYRVRYAIADVSAFVRPGGPLEAETWLRGETVYLPDDKVPLHPKVLSEGRASLLPDQVCPAVVWTIDLDADGEIAGSQVERAAVRSRAKLDYPGVQRDADAGRLAEPIALLPEVGALLAARALDRGGIDLPIPEQEVVPDGDGWRLVLRSQNTIERYNAQISLLTGRAAAALMLDGRIGLLRTMPPPLGPAVDRLRSAARALAIDWPAGTPVGRVVAAVDPGTPRGAAFLDAAASLMRGAGYTAFDGSVPGQPLHGAVAAPYAHVTAPLRRLADRYATEVCLALQAGGAPADWVRAALPRLPEVMQESDHRANTAGRGAVDLAEAVILAGRVGETFEAAVLDVDGPARNHRPPGGVVAIDDPAVEARCEGDNLPLGERIPVTLATADPARRLVLFRAAN